MVSVGVTVVKGGTRSVSGVRWHQECHCDTTMVSVGVTVV